MYIFVGKAYLQSISATCINMSKVPGVDPKIREIVRKYLTPQQPPPPQPSQPPLPSGNSIVEASFYQMLVAENDESVWRILRAMLDPAFLQSLLQDPAVSHRFKKVALLLLLVIASDSICSETSNKAKEILDELGEVQFCQEYEPYTYTVDDILQKMNIEASLSSITHKCAKCVDVPTLNDDGDGISCRRYDCVVCLHFGNGRDTVFCTEGTRACPAMQKTMAWANVARALMPLARVVANSSEYTHASEDLALPLDVWRCFYGFWALPMLFTAKKSLKYLKDALGIFEDQTRCSEVLWRHVSLLLHMQRVLQVKVRNPLKGELLDENRKTLVEFQEKYGRFLPPLSSPPLPSLSQ